MAVISSGQLSLTDLNDSPIGILSNEAHTIPTDSSGNNGNYSGASSTLSIFIGTTNDSANWGVTVAVSNVTGSLSGKTYTVTGLTADTGYVEFTATKSGYSNIVKRFTLSKNKQGSQGTPGAPGAPGEDGQDGVTTYTWVKYADDSLGGNMSDSPTGKRYVGMAFNQTSETESTSASAYKWSPLYDNVVVGGRNLYFDSYLERVVSYSSVSTLSRTDADVVTDSQTDVIKVAHNGVAGESNNFGFRQTTADQRVRFQTGKKYTLSFKARGNVTNFSYTYFMRASAEGGNSNTGSNPVTLYTNNWVDVTIYKDGPFDTVTGYILIGSSDGGAGKWFEVKEVKLEQGNIRTDFTISPEDIQDDINGKAADSDLDALAGIVSSVSADLNFKAGMGEFTALKEAYEARVEQEILDKAEVAAALATLEGRTALVETIAGNNKLVTEFINTVITESEEGIYIANGASSTGILIGSDRISFMDNNVEVAYISNQTMKINHGIFVESATISDFKFEKIPGTTILAITWVGV